MAAAVAACSPAVQRAASRSGPADGGSGDGGPGGSNARRWPPSRLGYANPIPDENRRAGDPGWRSGFTNPFSKPKQMEAYADRVSAKAGDRVNLMIATAAPGTVNWTLYRLGWYGGAGARPLTSGTAQVAPQPACPNDAATGLVRCAWAPAFAFTVPPDSVSGLYAVRLLLDSREHVGLLIPLVVRDDRPADLYFQSSVTTYQAYNDWGGESLYADRNDSLDGGFAVKVSFDRPYESNRSDLGTGQMLRYEEQMASFLERYGYDVSYTTNLDVAREGAAALLGRGAFLSVGHDEYWPGEERDAVQAARDAGVPLYFFGANAAYWKVRLSDPGVDGNARVMTCYKRIPERDPLAGTPQATGRYRDDAIGRPEEALVGVMYESWMLFGQPFVAFHTADPAYQGTGLNDGDAVPRLVGYEYDRTFRLGTPSPVTALSRSPLVDAAGRPGLSESVHYTAPGGAFVFAAGTIFWALGLDGPQRDPRIERMTANLLRMGLDVPVPEALLSVAAPAPVVPDPGWSTEVRTAGSGMPGPAGVAQHRDGFLVVADPVDHRIWRVDGSGKVSPFAGDGVLSSRFDGLPASQARFRQPTDVAADRSGNVYVSDTGNCAIRKIGNDANRTVTTLAGALGACGFADGLGGAARFDSPLGLAWRDATHLLVADSANQAVRTVDVTDGGVATLAKASGFREADGPAAAAGFHWPTAVAAAPDGRVFFVSSSTGTLKVINTDPARTIATLVAGGLGFADGPGTGARLQAQGGLLWWSDSLLVADPGNRRIRRVFPGPSASSTRVQTWAGSGLFGMADGSARTATFELPLGLALGADNLIYVADGGAGLVRAIRP